MPDLRRFGPEKNHLIPRRGARGLHAAVIQLPASMLHDAGLDQLAQRYDGAPILLDQPTSIVSLYLDPHGEMDEHDAPHDILFAVVSGSGFVRVGGPGTETIAVQAGDAISWPAYTLHKAWTADEALQAIVVNYAIAGRALAPVTFAVNAPVEPTAIADLREAVGWERHDEDYPAALQRYWATVSGSDATGKLIAWCAVLSDGVRHAVLLDVIVHPDWQWRGIGQSLVRHAVSHIQEHGISIIHVDFTNEYAGFYARCGFQIGLGGIITGPTP